MVTSLLNTKTVENAVDIPAIIGSDTMPGYVEKALDSDSTLSTAWLGLISNMVSAEIDIKACGAKPEVVQYVKECFFKRAARRFADFHGDLLNALIFGVAPFEVTMKFQAGKWWLDNLNFILPRHFDLTSLKKKPGEWWITGRCVVEHRRLVAIGAPGSGLPVVWWPIYGRGLLGTSLLRPLIDIHNEKADVIEQRRIAVQKSIQGSLIALTSEPTSLLEELNPSELQDVADELACCANGTDNAVALPPQIKSVTPIYPASDSISKSIEAENHCDLSILSAFGAQNWARGLLSSYGSNGAGQNDNRAQENLRGYFFQWCARQFQDLIDFFIDLNFGPQEYYPELTMISAAPQTPEALVRAMVSLAGAGALVFTEADELYMRRMLRLPLKQGLPLPPKQDTAAGYYSQKTGIDSRKDRNDEYERAKYLRAEAG